jgi:hypothetical protein
MVPMKDFLTQRKGFHLSSLFQNGSVVLRSGEALLYVYVSVHVIAGAPFPIYIAPGETRIYKTEVVGLNETAYPAGKPSQCD